MRKLYYNKNDEKGREKLIVVQRNLHDEATELVRLLIDMCMKQSRREWVSDMELEANALSEEKRPNPYSKALAAILEKGEKGADFTNSVAIFENCHSRFFKNESELARQLIGELKDREAGAAAPKAQEEASMEELDIFSLDEEDEETEDSGETSALDSQNLEEDWEEDNEEEGDEKKAALDGDGAGDGPQGRGSKEELEELEEDIQTEERKDRRNEDDIQIQRLEEIFDQIQSANQKGPKAERRPGDKEILAKFVNELRILRNRNFGHDTHGAGKEEAGEVLAVETYDRYALDPEIMEPWADKIIEIINFTMELLERYQQFDSQLRVSALRPQLVDLKIVVNRTKGNMVQEEDRKHILFEFCGDIYYSQQGYSYMDENDTDFLRLTRSMVRHWNMGISCLLLDQSKDFPEMNEYFRYVLGSQKYVNIYLRGRNALKKIVKTASTSRSIQLDIQYFKIINALNEDLDAIYWRGRRYTEAEFARKLLYYYMHASTMEKFNSRLRNYEYVAKSNSQVNTRDGFDLANIVNMRMLSEGYYAHKKGKTDAFKAAKSFEDSFKAYRKAVSAKAKPEEQRNLYGKMVQAMAELAYQMTGKAVFQMHFDKDAWDDYSSRRELAMAMFKKAEEMERLSQSRGEQKKALDILVDWCKNLEKNPNFTSWRELCREIEDGWKGQAASSEGR